MRWCSYHAPVLEYAVGRMVAYLGLGSNLGDRQAALQHAVELLVKRVRFGAVSSVYQTQPEHGAAQPCYLNAAIRIETDLEAPLLLRHCLEIEHASGRIRPTGLAKAPRIIDIDVLLCGSIVAQEPYLILPHPRLLARPFVRIPLAEVALPGLCHPVTGEALDRCPPEPSVERLPGCEIGPSTTH